jgi:mannose-6-phosphate isomerase-like protein (cupin superfamily)
MPDTRTVQKARKAKPKKPAALTTPGGWKRGKLLVTHERDTVWDRGLRAFFEYRDLGFTERTGGRLMAQVIRPSAKCDKPGDRHYHLLDCQFVYVLKGWARVWFEGVGEVRFEAGSCMYQEPSIEHRVVEYSDDYTVIEITLPAEFETVSLEP